MYRLVEYSGLDDALYRGGRVAGLREGLGIQLFPNGYIYYGNWVANKAHGKGQLIYTDGTIYKGEYEDNSIVRGTLAFWNKRRFEGEFYGGQNEFFKEGTFHFSDGDCFEGKWNSFGACVDGTFHTAQGDSLRFEKQRKLVKYDNSDQTLGKIIMNDIIYEGGVKGEAREGFGYIYSTFQHYNNSFFLNDRYNGLAIGNRISFGETCEGHIYNDKMVHIWKRHTVRGYEVTGDVSDSKYYVKFPFLNDDFYFGSLDIDWKWNQNHHVIRFKEGTLHRRVSPSEYEELPISNISNIYEVPEMQRRPVDFAFVFERIKSFYKIKGLFELEANALDNLAELTRLGLSPNRLDNIAETFFSGTLIHGQKTGFGTVVLASGRRYSGFFSQGHFSGRGRLSEKDFQSIGTFHREKLRGRGVFFDKEGNAFAGEFGEGPTQHACVKLKGFLAHYIGGVEDFRFHGTGRLVCEGRFEIKASFLKGEVDPDSPCEAKLLDIGTEYCGRPLSVSGKKCLFILEVRENVYLVFDLAKGKYGWQNFEEQLKS